MSGALEVPPAGGVLHVAPAFRELARRLGLATAAWAFVDPRIDVWRSIRERENGVLDLDGERLHVKRDRPGFRAVADEARGLALLEAAGIGTAPLVAHGRLADGRSFVVTRHLAGFEDAQRALGRGLPFERLSRATAAVAARLHAAGLHHRDLYLGHFWVAPAGAGPPEVRLIDAGRVRRLPRLLARRWIVKDLGQFAFSLAEAGVAGPEREAWLARYADLRGTAPSARLAAAVSRRAARIARHHARSTARDASRNRPLER